jgi:nucleoid-associated protein YgaU
MKNFVYVIVAVLMAICLWNMANQEDFATKEYIVTQGDTIWSIADNHCDAGTDIRKTVYTIYDINRINQNEDIYPGQAILIPVRK